MFYTFKDYLTYVGNYKKELKDNLNLEHDPEFKAITLSALKSLSLQKQFNPSPYESVLKERLQEMHYLQDSPEIKFTSPIHQGVIYLLALDGQVTFDDYIYLYHLYKNNNPSLLTINRILSDIRQGIYTSSSELSNSFQVYPFNNFCFHLANKYKGASDIIAHHEMNYVSSVINGFDLLLPIVYSGEDFFVTTFYWDLKLHDDYFRDMCNKMSAIGVASVCSERDLINIVEALYNGSYGNTDFNSKDDPISWCLCDKLPYSNNLGYENYSYKILVMPNIKIY